MLYSLIFLLNTHLLFHASLVCAVATPIPAPKLLNITTIGSNTLNESTHECWQMIAPFATSTAAGVSGAVVAQLGDTALASYGVIPARFDGGLHNAPAVQ